MFHHGPVSGVALALLHHLHNVVEHRVPVVFGLRPVEGDGATGGGGGNVRGGRGSGGGGGDVGDGGEGAAACRVGATHSAM